MTRLASVLACAAVLAGGCLDPPTPADVSSPDTADAADTAADAPSPDAPDAGLICPATLPIKGSNCDAPGTCVIADAPQPCGGTQDVTATCALASDGIHLWSYEMWDCNGDPASCGDYTNPTVCAADTSCRYLAPGCGEPDEPTFATACYNGFDCDDTSCPTGTTCTTVTSDPCLSFCSGCSVCGACGQQVKLCL